MIIQKEKIKGAILGYMIGDALGLPIAGMTKEDVDEHIGSVTDYIVNFRHPFFYFLKKGQYGSNTRQMIATLESLAENKSFNITDIKSRLHDIAVKSKKDFFYSRWMGETVTQALLTGKPVSNYSISCVYRSIPIAMLENDLDTALAYSDKQTILTHSSPTSRASSYFVSYVLRSLANGGDPKSVVSDATLRIKSKFKDISLLTDNLESLINNKITSTEEAREQFGTGSLSYQTIPVAVAIFLRFPHNFEKAVFEGIASYRVVKPEEREEVSRLTYVEELIHCRGGHTDGIAGLAGAFVGALNGFHIIPERFLHDLEDKEKVMRIISETQL